MHRDLISAMEAFIHMEEDEKELISSLFVIRNYPKGEFFLREGQVCREAGFIRQGLIRYFTIRDNGEEYTSEFGRENDFFCNYESFLDHSPSRRNIQCIEPVTMLVISYDQLQRLYREVKNGQQFGRLLCEYLYVYALKKIESMYNETPEQRYLHFAAQYPDLQQRLPQYYISSFVGVKPPSLSRIRKRLAASRPFINPG